MKDLATVILGENKWKNISKTCYKWDKEQNNGTDDILASIRHREYGSVLSTV